MQNFKDGSYPFLITIAKKFEQPYDLSVFWVYDLRATVANQCFLFHILEWDVESTRLLISLFRYLYL